MSYWLAMWWVFPIALPICVTVCTLGIEGAILFVPFFTIVFPLLAFNLTPLQAISIGLITEVFGFASSLTAFWRAGLIDFDIAIGSALKSVPFALVGGILSFFVPQAVLLIVIALTLFFMALLLYRAPSETELLGRAEDEEWATAGRMTETGSGEASSFRSLTDASGWTYRYRYCDDWRRAATISFGGLFEGLVGFGIGIFGVSDLVLRRVPIRVAIGTSHFIIMVTALAAVTPHLFQVFREANAIPWNVVAMTVPAVLAGGQLAAIVAGRLDPDKVRRFLVGFLVVLVAILLYRAARMFGGL